MLLLFAFAKNTFTQGCLVASYDFSGNAQDNSGNGLHGTVVGATLTTDRFSNPNSAYSFNGISDYITIPHNPLLNFEINEDFSITCWVKLPANQNWTPSNQRNIILTKWDDNGGGNDSYPYTMAVMNQTSGGNNGQASCYVFDAGCSGLSINQSTTSINDNQWHFVAFTKEADTLRIYIDCNLETTFINTSTCSTVNTNDFYIGRKGLNFNPTYFTGDIDDINIYDCAFDQSQLCNMMSAPCTQGSTTTFQKVFGGAGNERAHSVQQTADGGYIIVGETTSFGAGGLDIFVMKTDANANVQWTKTYGGSLDDDGNSIVIKQATDGGYIVTGKTESFGAGSFYDSYILKLDATGNIQWEKRVPGSSWDHFRDIVELSTGEFLLTGSASTFSNGFNDVHIVKLSVSGNLIWNKSIGTVSREHSNSVIELSNGNYVFCGNTNVSDIRNSYLVCTDTSGTIIWSSQYGGGGTEDYFEDVVQLSDGNILALGNTQSYGAGGKDVWLVKLDTNGTVIWSKAYGGANDERGINVVEKSNGDLILTSLSASYGNSNEMVVIMTDSLGSVLSSKAYGSTLDDEFDFWGYPMDLLPNEEFILVGGTRNYGAVGEDIYVIKANICGDSYCNDNDIVPNEVSPSVVGLNYSLSTVIGGALSNTTSASSNISFSDNVLCADTVEISNSCTQGAATTFQKVFSGAGDERAHSVQQTADGGYIVVGETTSFGAGNKDWFVMKTDANANPQWTKTFGSTFDDDGNSIIVKQTSDLGYVLCGYTQGFGASGNDPYIIRLDSNGNLLWERRITGSGNDYFRDVKETVSGSFIISGTSNSYGAGNSDFYLSKIDLTGNLLWTKTFGGTSTEHSTSVIDAVNCYYISGSAKSYGTGQDDALLIKTDTNGNIIWSKAYLANNIDYFYTTSMLNDGNLIHTGGCNSYGSGGRDILVMKTDTSGNIIWQYVYGGIDEERGIDISENSNGEIIVNARTESFGSGNADLLLLNLDNSGNLNWAKSYGAVNDDDFDNWGSSLALCSDTGQIIVGGTFNYGAVGEDIYIVKTNQCGDSYCNEAFENVIRSTASLVANNVTPSVSSGGTDVVTNSSISNISFSDNVLCADTVEIINPCTQGAATTFQKVFGDAGNERAHSIQQTADGGYIIVGETTSFGAGNKDWFVMKTDVNANPQWTKTFGGTGNEDGLSITVEQTSDGGYIVVGETTSFGASGRDPYIIKMDNAGNILWEKVFPGNGNDYFRDVIETSDGDIMAVGCSNSVGAGSVDHLVVRLSSNGVFKWGKTYGSSNSDQSYSIIEYSNNEFYVNGHILGGGDYSGYVYKIDSLGTLIWAKTYDGGPGFEVMYSTSKLQDGNLIHAGTTDSYGPAGRNFWIMKTNPLGNIIWSKAIGGNTEDRASKIMETPNNELVFSGISNSFGAGGNDFLVVNADSLGNVNFSNTFGGVNNDDMEYYGEIMDLCNDSGFIFVGGNRSISFGGEDIYIVKTNSCLESFCYTNNAPVISSNAPLVASPISPSVVNFNAPINSNSLVSSITFIDTILCIDSVALSFQCNVNANFSSTQFCEGDTTLFTDLSTDSIGNIVNWQWYFGDGDSLIGTQNPSHLYSSSGSFNVTLVVTTDSNCVDSITIPITINPLFNVNENDTICQGDSILLGGAYQTASGVYTDSLQTTLGCDSVVTTNLVVNPVYDSTQNSTICQGDSILFNGNFYSVTGVYTDSLQTLNGCDSVLNLNLVVNPVFSSIQNDTICQGDSVLFNGNFYSSAGFYADSLQTINGCDSILNLNLIVNPTYNVNRSDTICQGDSILLGGSYQTSIGVYTDSLQSILSCDSVVITSLVVNPTYTSTQNSTICQGDSLLFNGNYYFTSGIYTDSLQTVAGCDSLLTLSLTVNPVVQNIQNLTICQGDSVFLNGGFQTTSGAYTDSLQTALGCDSLIVTNLIVAPIYNDSVSTSICEGDSILLGGSFQTTPGTYVDNLQSTFGCDSVVTTSLTVDTVSILIVSNDTSASPCQGVQLNVSGGSSYLWSPSDYLSCTNCYNPIASPPYTITYSVSDPSNNCSLPNSVTVYVDGEAEFIIPNVFTPNRDDNNDLFNIKSDCIYSLEKKIYNRWGQLLFQSSQINEGWNGRTTAGAEVPEGTYFYIIEVGYFVSGTETTETFTGYVTLLR